MGSPETTENAEATQGFVRKISCEAPFTNRPPSAIFAALMLPIFINILLVVNVLVCLLLILLTLMQRPKNEGLGAALGGGMTDNLFGAQTTNVLAKATRVLAGIFFFLTLTLSVLYTHQANSPSAVQARLAAKPAPKPADVEADKQSENIKALIMNKMKEVKPEASATPAAK
jgi:preprotein translocase subunit SecG